jgi:hypothetical protein
MVATAAAERSATVWAHRAFSETCAERHYLRLARQCSERELTSHWARHLCEAAKDEARHAELCLDRARLFGLSAVLDEAAETPSPFAPGTVRGVVFEIVSTFCVGETLNAALLQRELEEAEPADLRRLTHELLKDELRHAKLGWSCLRDAAAKMDLGFLAAPLRAAFDRSFKEVLGSASSTLASPIIRELVTDGLGEIVLPGLRSVGIELAFITGRSARPTYDPRA